MAADPSDGGAGTFPYGFLVGTLVIAIAIGVVVTYLGIHGQIGAGIP